MGRARSRMAHELTATRAQLPYAAARAARGVRVSGAGLNRRALSSQARPQHVRDAGHESKHHHPRGSAPVESFARRWYAMSFNMECARRRAAYSVLIATRGL